MLCNIFFIPPIPSVKYQAHAGQRSYPAFYLKFVDSAGHDSSRIGCRSLKLHSGICRVGDDNGPVGSGEPFISGILVDQCHVVGAYLRLRRARECRSEQVEIGILGLQLIELLL